MMKMEIEDEENAIPNENYILRVENLGVNFYTLKGKLNVIKNVSFNVRQGEILGIVGETGCGKTVTSMALVDQLPLGRGIIENGKIIFKGVDLAQIYRKKHTVRTNKKGKTKIRINKVSVKKNRIAVRNSGIKISLIFQDSMASLDPLYRISTQLLETILNVNYEKVLSRLSEKSKLYSDRGFMNQLEKTSSFNEFLKLFNSAYGNSANFAEELFFINELNLKNDEKIKMLRASLEAAKVFNSSNTNKMILARKLSNIHGKNRIFTATSLARKIKRKRKDAYITEALIYAKEMLEFAGIKNSEVVLFQYPHQLSGGMRQRVMIALAIAADPDLIIADEPTTALDVITQAGIIRLFRNLNREFGRTIITISHNLGVISHLCDSVCVMYAGNIVEYGRTEELFKNPLHPYTRGLIGCLPSSNNELLEAIPGSLPSLSDPPKGCLFYDRCSSAMEICRDNYPPPVKYGYGVVNCWLYSGEKKNDE